MFWRAPSYRQRDVPQLGWGQWKLKSKSKLGRMVNTCESSTQEIGGRTVVCLEPTWAMELASKTLTTKMVRDDLPHFSALDRSV